MAYESKLKKILTFPYYLPPKRAVRYLGIYAMIMSLGSLFFALVASNVIEWLIPCLAAACAVQGWLRVIAIRRGYLSENQKK